MPPSETAAAPTRGDLRRQAILDGIEGLLRDRPIAALSVEDVTEAAGITRSGFYFYFESKYAALSALLGGVWEEMAEAAAPFLEGSDEDPATYVSRTVADVHAAWQRHEHLLVAMLDASGSDPGVRALWEAWMQRWIGSTAGRIEAERAAGRAPDGPPAEALANVLLRMNERAFDATSRNRTTARQNREMVQALATVWLASVWGERSE